MDARAAAALLLAAACAGAARAAPNGGNAPARDAEPRTGPAAPEAELKALGREVEAALQENRTVMGPLYSVVQWCRTGANYEPVRAGRDDVRANVLRSIDRLKALETRCRAETANLSQDLDAVARERGRYSRFSPSAIRYFRRVAGWATDLADQAGKGEKTLKDEQVECGGFLVRHRRQALGLRGAAALAAAAFAFLAAWAARGRRIPSLGAPGVAGRVVGDYRLLREIGRGGMGVVYAAEDPALKRRVAIKRMRGEIGEISESRQMFLKEARLVAGLSHPNIVKIYAILVEGLSVFLVFEMIEGRSLDAALREDGRMAPERALDVIRQAGAALDYAHANRIIHRDLKPSNVMLEEGGGVKVMDFGIAHQAKATVGRLTRTAAWGTPHYMSPEQELGAVSRESDIYALGVCLYEMLTGALPFEGPDFLGQKRRMEWAPARRRVPELPEAVEAVLSRALESDPARRFHSGAELAKALEAALRPPA
ncbi:MAG TPA: serine/threonine-protein kinase [Elusimicrobiota bacterium]|nr:serine/threonine-protein kinase [Elusimicrobiota bacterium]